MNDELKMLQTPSGVRFGSLGERRASPAPTLIIVGSDLEYSLTNDEINKVGRLLGGAHCFGLDVPGHGIDVREGEPQSLGAWRARLDKNENFVAKFARDISDILDYLIADGYSDPARIAVAGTSRGGFMGLHAMAEDSRIRAGVSFAPISELTILNEFKGLERHALTQSLALSQIAAKLADRPLWFCIGNNDRRVGTDSLIDFTRRVVAACKKGKTAPVEIHIMETEDHHIHDTAHEEAAEWLRKTLIL